MSVPDRPPDTVHIALDAGNSVLDVGNSVLDAGNIALDVGNSVLDAGNIALDVNMSVLPVLAGCTPPYRQPTGDATRLSTGLCPSAS